LCLKLENKEKVYHVGDISKLTNMIDALGIIQKKGCFSSDKNAPNRYKVNPCFDDDYFRKRFIGLMLLTLKGKTSYHFSERINKRYKVSYKKTICEIWKDVPDEYMDGFKTLTPTHEQEVSTLYKFKVKIKSEEPHKDKAIKKEINITAQNVKKLINMRDYMKEYDFGYDMSISSESVSEKIIVTHEKYEELDALFSGKNIAES